MSFRIRQFLGVVIFWIVFLLMMSKVIIGCAVPTEPVSHCNSARALSNPLKGEWSGTIKTDSVYFYFINDTLLNFTRIASNGRAITSLVSSYSYAGGTATIFKVNQKWNIYFFNSTAMRVILPTMAEPETAKVYLPEPSPPSAIVHGAMQRKCQE